MLRSTITVITIILMLPLFVGSCASVGKASETDKFPEFNQIVLDVAKSYPTDGTHGYWWPRSGEGNYDGVSKDIYLDGKKVLSGEPEGRTYCCGFTLEVFIEAYKRYEDKYGDRILKPLKAEDIPEFRHLWFVVDVNGPGPSAALEKFGLGKQIDRSQALPGDFVQIWRRWDKTKKKNGSGHSVIFLDWVKDDEGNVIGFKYFSTQPGTNGVSENTELFGAPDADKGIADEYTWWGRVNIPLKPAK